jgi:hypothetical protein
MKKPTQVAGAHDMIRSMREALGEALDRHGKDGWDREVVAYEMARLFGAMLRGMDTPPSRLDEVVTYARGVYAGIHAESMVSLEVMIERLAAPSDSRGAEESEDTVPAGVTLQ